MSTADLDQRLAIIYHRCDVSNNRVDDSIGETEAIKQIKQAFDDEGIVTIDQAQLMVKNSHHGCMTGKEWLEAYQQELRGKVFNYNGDQDAVVAAVHACDNAARKAAGLA